MQKPYVEQLAQAAQHLSRNDSRLATVITIAGPCQLEPHGEYYRALGDSIIGQQLSVASAAAIKKRFREFFNDHFPSPQQILQTSIEELRSVGFSRAKAIYIQDLAQHIVDGKIRFDRLNQQSNQEIIDELTAVKGIGEWTVHMFLMFCVGRLDVLAYGDLGIRSAIKNLYGFDHLPTRQETEAIASQYKWHPYETVAGWYLWRSLENAPQI